MNSPSFNCPSLYPIQEFMYVNKTTNETNQHRRVMVFDTETTGLLKFIKMNGMQELKMPLTEQPHLTQLSYMIYDLNLDQVVHIGNRYCRLPEGIQIQPEASAITGITSEILEEKGRYIVDVLIEFIYEYLSCDVLVAHNWYFDKSLLEIEIKRNMSELVEKSGLAEEKIAHLFRYDYYHKHDVYNYCTMLESVHLCDIKRLNRYGEPTKQAKYPKLVELYKCLFDDMPDGQLHNSLYDVCACLRCFLKMKVGKEMPRNRYYHLLRDCDFVNNGKEYSEIKNIPKYLLNDYII